MLHFMYSFVKGWLCERGTNRSKKTRKVSTTKAQLSIREERLLQCKVVITKERRAKQVLYLLSKV